MSTLRRAARVTFGRRLSLSLGLVALVVAGCGAIPTASPVPTPADFGGIASEFAKRGLHIDHVVSGDAGCVSSVLSPTAIGFDASGLDQAAIVRIHLYIFRDRATFERLRSTIDDCARSFVTDPATYETIEQSPFVVASQGPWGSQFETTLRTGLEVAAGSGN